MESHIFGFLFVMAVCAYSCASLPASGRRQDDIKQLVSLLGKLKNLEKVRRQQAHHSHHLSKQQQQLLSGVSLSSRHSPASSSVSGFVSNKDQAALKALTPGARGISNHFPTEAFTSPDVTNSLLHRDLDSNLGLDLADDSAAGLFAGRNSGGRGSASASEKSKRQGAWSYDYGLGGGRFGKRSYGDYGIGGGRYGRDVDHVDISDTSDADASTL